MLFHKERGQPILLVVLGISLAIATGCDVGTTSTVATDPASAAATAIRDNDSNGDGVLDGDELKAVLSLSEALSRVDSNADGKLTADEIEARLRKYANLSAFIAGEVQVVRGRQAVEGAEIVFTPETFMGNQAPTYRGTTRSSGTTSMQAVPPTPGIAIGFYRATIKTPDGEQVERGIEVADDAPSVGRIVFEI